MSKLHWITRALIGALVFCTAARVFHIVLSEAGGSDDLAYIMASVVAILMGGPMFASITRPTAPIVTWALEDVLAHYRKRAKHYEGTQAGADALQMVGWLAELQTRRTASASIGAGTYCGHTRATEPNLSCVPKEVRNDCRN